MSTSPEYGEVLAHLREARAALSRAEQALDLVGPGANQPGALDDLVVGIQMSADLVGRRTGTNERERAVQSGHLDQCCPTHRPRFVTQISARF